MINICMITLNFVSRFLFRNRFYNLRLNSFLNDHIFDSDILTSCRCLPYHIIIFSSLFNLRRDLILQLTFLSSRLILWVITRFPVSRLIQSILEMWFDGTIITSVSFQHLLWVVNKVSHALSVLNVHINRRIIQLPSFFSLFVARLHILNFKF